MSPRRSITETSARLEPARRSKRRSTRPPATARPVTSTARTDAGSTGRVTRMGIAGRERVRRNFLSTRNLRDYLRLFNALRTGDSSLVPTGELA